jgi:predicted membrane protein
VTTPEFTGANLPAIFGGAELDLRDAEMTQRPAHVSAIAMFGGVEVTVPEDWNVNIDVLPIFGGASDERGRTERTHDEVDLVVTGFAAFGGVEVTG